MKRPFAVAVVLLLVAFALPDRARAVCPVTNFTCGFSVGQAAVFDGTARSGKPEAIVGTLSIDAMGNATLNALENDNGTAKPPQTLTGTCSTSNGLGVLSLMTAGGDTLGVTFATAAGNSKLLFIADTGPAPDSVAAGICGEASTLTTCPTTGSCAFTSAGAMPIGSANQGQPEVTSGTITFGASGSISFLGESNVNGGGSGVSVNNGTCSVANGIATVDFSGGLGPKIALVAANTGFRAIGLPTTDSSVTVGTCVP